jgi:hypothetical protein
LLYLLLYLWPNAKYFAGTATLSFDPYRPTILLNVSVEFFFKHCSPDPNFKFPADINFEYSFEKKSYVITNILNYFEKHILAYEDRQYYFYDRLRRQQFLRLFKKAHW